MHGIRDRIAKNAIAAERLKQPSFLKDEKDSLII